MKQNLLSFILLLSFCFTFAQNDWFVSFGQSPDEVKTFLEGKNYLQTIQEDTELQRMLAVVEDGKQVEYVFKSGKLIATSVRREYTSKAEAKIRLQSTLRYMENVSAGEIEKTSEGNTTCYYVKAKGRHLKLFVLPGQIDVHGQILQLTAINKEQGKTIPENKFYYDSDMMEQYAEEKAKRIELAAKSVSDVSSPKKKNKNRDKGKR
ncbi:MAG: hypothetical protein AAFR66_20845 [Bacteroidota bacterium]